MIGGYRDRPAAFSKALASRALTLVAYACGSASGFSEDAALADDLRAAGAAIAFAAAFPGTHVAFGSATRVSPGPADAKLATAARFYNAAAALGATAGVPVAVHPSSHHDTLLLTRDDYDRLFARLDPGVGWVPDTGHILRGGQDIQATLQAHRPRIRYLHLKDVGAEGGWRMLGAGICDVPAVVAAVREAPAFNGWLVLEEESDEARRDPAAAVAANRRTMRALVR
jgi:sugar phosphate isomerase/epimerase